MVKVEQGPSPEVDEVCLREIPAAGKPEPAPGVFLACASSKLGAPSAVVIAGKTVVSVPFGPVPADSAHVTFYPVSCDSDRTPKLCSSVAADRVFAPSAISPPKLLELALQALSSAADAIREAMVGLGVSSPDAKIER